MGGWGRKRSIDRLRGGRVASRVICKGAACPGGTEMKKSGIVFAALAVLMSFVAVSCNEPHVHCYGDSYVKDGEVFHDCLCGVVEKVEDAVIVGTEADLKEAIAGEPKTIFISNDIDLTSSIEIKDGRVVDINLNGKSVSIENNGIYIQNAQVSISGKGELAGGVPKGPLFLLLGSNDAVQDYSMLTIGKDVMLRASYFAISVDKNSDEANTENRSCGVVVNLKGSVEAPCGVYVNGTVKSTVCAPVINLDGACIISNDVGIYAAGYAKWNINNTTIEGAASAIEIRAGELSIDGGFFKSTAKEYVCNPKDGGNTTKAAAIAVAQHTTGLPINVSIKNTALEGCHGLAVENPQDNKYEALSKIRVEFDSSVGTPHYDSAYFVNEGNVIIAKKILK